MKIEKVLKDLLEIQKMFETTVSHLNKRVDTLEEQIAHLEDMTETKLEEMIKSYDTKKEKEIKETKEKIAKEEPKKESEEKVDDITEIDKVDEEIEKESNETLSPLDIAKKEITPILTSEYHLDIRDFDIDTLAFTKDNKEKTIRIFISRNYIPSNFIDYWRGWHSVPPAQLKSADYYIFAVLDEKSKNNYIVFNQEELDTYMENKTDEKDVRGNVSFYFEKDDEGKFREQRNNLLNFEKYLNHWDIFK